MTKPPTNKIELIEVGPRDGLQNEKAIIDTADKIALINALNHLGVQEIEVSAFVSAKRIREYGVPSSIRIQVKDNGPGIPEDMLEMVFEKFRQVDATHTREHSGTGLGLAICRELADLLHSTLGVESAHGMGSSFYVDVPEVFASESLEPLMPE